MDYGSFLGRTLNIKGKKYNPNVQSKHYTKQSKFEGSDRQIRGKILEILLQEKKQITTQKLFQSLQDLSNDNLRIKSIINQLIKENFIEVKNQKIWLKK
jgi:A/G-specific adenine glycosylase